MSKKIIVSAMALTFLLSTAVVGFAAKVKCTVDAVDGDKVSMTCAKADKLNAGDKVTVKSKKAGGKKAIEGC